MGDPLPVGWEDPIPEAIWPEALLSAVRADAGALGVRRVIETIRRWQSESRDASHPERQKEARGRLRSLARVISGDGDDLQIADFDVDGIETALPDLQMNDAFTVDAFDVVPKPKPMNAAKPISAEDAVLKPDKRSSKPPTGVKPSERIQSMETPRPEMLAAMLNSPREFEDEDEHPTIAGTPDDLPALPQFYRGARIDPFAEEDEKPTASIAIPEEIQRRAARRESGVHSDDSPTNPPITIPPDDTKELEGRGPPPTMETPRSSDWTVASRDMVPPSVKDLQLPPPPSTREREPREIPSSREREPREIPAPSREREPREIPSSREREPREIPAPSRELQARDETVTPMHFGGNSREMPALRDPEALSSRSMNAVREPADAPSAMRLRERERDNPPKDPSNPRDVPAPSREIPARDKAPSREIPPREKAPSRESALPPPPPPPDPFLDDAESKSLSGLAPKPGIVRRRAMSRRQSPARPRAAMQQVRALHSVVRPLCEELIPLNVERRSRRFWARWREVAGDRGVRRDFVEQLLQNARDVRTLVCELIAEVQTVDVRSVYALVDKIEAGEKPATGPRPSLTPERQRGPLVGASIRVEGVNDDEDDE